MPRLNKEPSAAQLAAREAGAARLRAANETRGKVRPVRSTRNDVDTTDHKIGQDKTIEMPSTGKARLVSDAVEVIDRPVNGEKLKLLAFMEEEMVIVVHDSTHKDDEEIPYVINGGKRQAFIRGEEQSVRRKYVEVLARMKRRTFTQEKYKDTQGIDSIRQIPHSGLVYPFTVVSDPNPRGRAWLKAILAEA